MEGVLFRSQRPRWENHEKRAEKGGRPNSLKPPAAARILSRPVSGLAPRVLQPGPFAFPSEDSGVVNGL
jgi:hypothetical protein